MQLNALKNKALKVGTALANRARYGAPQGKTQNAAYAAAFPSRWHLAIEAQPPQRTTPKPFGECIAKFDLSDSPYPALGVLEVPNGSVYGSSGWTFTADGQFLADCSWYGMAPEARLPFAFKKPRELTGTCLSLGSEFCAGNYGHYILDCLTRFGIFQRAGLDVRELDHIYLPKPFGRTAHTILQELGIPEEKCVWAQSSEVIRAERLLVTSFPGRRRDYAPWIPQFLQGPLSSHPPASPHRVYIPRDGVRRVANEAQLLEIATGFGFTAFDFRQCQHEPSYFHAAEAVIGPHGAGMTNLAFCRPGTKVLELIPSDHVYPYFYTLADSAALDYHYLVGQSTHDRPPGTRGPSPYDFQVQADAFEAALNTMFPHRRNGLAG